MVRNTSPIRVLFVCGGNTCRSPMAVGLALKFVDCAEMRFESAGLDTGSDYLANSKAITVMGEFGIDISGHRTRPVSSVKLGDFDYVVAMTDCIAKQLLQRYPICGNCLITWQVPDPYCGELKEYRECAELIRKSLFEFIAS